MKSFRSGFIRGEILLFFENNTQYSHPNFFLYSNRPFLNQTNFTFELKKDQASDFLYFKISFL